MHNFGVHVGDFMELNKMLQLEDGWEGKGWAGWGGTVKRVDVCFQWPYASPQSMRPLKLSIP